MNDLQSLLSTLHRNRHDLDFLNLVMSEPKPKIKQGVEGAVEALRNAVARNRKGHAITAARTLLVLAGPLKAVIVLKRHAVMRASSFSFQADAVAAIAADWIEHAAVFKLEPGTVQYLTSVTRLLALAPEVRKLYCSILMRLRTGRAGVVKGLLAELDAVFTFGKRGEDFRKSDDDPMNFGMEELAEGFSYLLNLYYTQFGLAAANFVTMDADAGADGRFRTLMMDAAAISRYREAEILVEGFPYDAVHNGTEVRVSSRERELELSIRLGFIQTQLQFDADQYHLNATKNHGHIASAHEFADKFFAVHGNKVATLVGGHIPRYRLELPMSQRLQALFADDYVFLEEMSGIEALGYEDYITPVEVPDVVLDNGVTVSDVFKVQRLLGFMHYGLVKTLEMHQPVLERGFVYRHSCLPVFRRSVFLQVLAHAVGSEKAQSMLELLLAELSSPSLDIQYAPVIAAGDHVILSMAVLSRSNLVRNLNARLKKRIGRTGQGDRMQASLAAALRSAGFAVVEEFELATGANPLEVDLVAYCEDVLIIFECKNTYAPCNVYELRNTYDAVLKAGEQLSLRQAWLADPVNQASLFERTGWGVPAQLRVRTCVAMGNRIFNGYFVQGHPVCQTHELLNVLEDGIIRTEEDVLSMWAGEKFAVEDLLAYMAGTTIHGDMANAMEAMDEVTQFGQMRLVCERYVLNMGRLMDVLLTRYSTKKS